MAWQSAHYIEHPSVSAFMALAAHDTIIFRSMHQIVAWNTHQWQAPLWTYQLVNDKTMGAKALVHIGNTVISYNDPPQEEQPRRVIALDIHAGTVVWERSLDLLISQAGLLATKQQLFVHGYDLAAEQYVLMELDIHTGATQAQASSIGLSSAAASQTAIFVASPSQVMLHPVHDLQQTSSLAMHNTSLLAVEHAVYAHFLEEHTTSFLVWDSLPAQQATQITLAAIPSTKVAGAFLAALPVQAQIGLATYAPGLGVWGIDLAHQQIIWQALNDATTLVSGLTATPHGLIAWAQGGHPLYTIDTVTGKQQPITTRLVVIHAAFWLHQQLILTGLDEAEIFVWQE